MLPARVYLNVPYAEKNQAKALGARWDATRKLWYASECNVVRLRKWLTKTAPAPKAALRDVPPPVSQNDYGTVRVVSRKVSETPTQTPANINVPTQSLDISFLFEIQSHEVVTVSQMRERAA